MSKTTFEPKVKGVTYGTVDTETKASVSKEEFKGADAYEQYGASKWKGMGLSTTVVTTGPSGISSDALNLLVRKPKQNEYMEHFDEVELPPDFIEAKDLFPVCRNDLADAIEESLEYYKDYLALYSDRRDNAEKALASGKTSPYDARILKEFIGKLDDATNKVKEQVRALKEFRKEKLGDI